jgi:hypothetical protein
MFIVETRSAKVARKTSIFVAIGLALTGSFGALLTMHFYSRPKGPQPIGWRVFGFPRK